MDPAAKAQRQTAQLAALLTTESGKALMQQHLGDLVHRRQQQQIAAQQQQLAAAVLTPFTPSSCADAAAPDQADETTCSLAELHPKVLQTAIAVSRTAPGSADRAAGLAQLKQALMQHAPLSTALALAAAGTGGSADLSYAAASAAALDIASFPEPSSPQQQPAAATQQQPEVKAPCSPSTSSMAADGEPLTCAVAWSMLQQQDSVTAGAMNLGLLRNDTIQSMQSWQSMHQDASADPAVLSQLSGISRGASKQMVFKRRASNSAALRRHFSSTSKTARTDSGGFSKPQQVFKKQRKRPLMLWSSSSNLAQQVQSLKQPQQQQQVLPAHSQVTEPEYSTMTASSSGATGPMLQALLDARLQMSGGTAAAAMAVAATAVPAALSTQASGVDNVLSTLARQEQQLLLLQQQLRQQRELIAVRRQAQQQQAAAAVAPSGAIKALELELLLSHEAAAAAGAMTVADVEMSEAYDMAPAAAPKQPPAEPQAAGAVTPDAIATLMSLAKALAAKQQQQQTVAPAAQSVSWDADVLRKLTAALLTA